MILLAALATVVLYPVAGDDTRLQDEGTIISPDAVEAIETGSDTVLCMDLPEDASSHDRACLTRAEWDTTLELAEADAAQRDSVQARERALTNAYIYLR
ncbi:hypothetical protein [Aurantiacibacter zhengii]|uniref:Uncharacterized protein n=1 Tax=Aurantiacibacter zhengii TaxID=2307003 RepID=A0A418NWJ6_9SPHN|nr:hypothetical protein [Aurantiacibacter zhengii]RIV88945.1 hypothetical protein D2V07_01320 [Aurantiacibacter zhengii]